MLVIETGKKRVRQAQAGEGGPRDRQETIRNYSVGKILLFHLKKRRKLQNIIFENLGRKIFFLMIKFYEH